MRKDMILSAAALALAGLTSASMAATYTGNGATGFNGGVGLGQLQVTDDGSGNLVFAFTPGNGNTNLGGNNLVLYLDTKAGGLADTSTLTDEQDEGRRLVSGTYANNPNSTNTTTRTTEVFSPGFGADYGIDFETGVYANVFDITGTASNFPYAGGNAIGANGPYTLTIAKTAIGLPATGDYTFNLVGSQISGSIYRSNETFGVSATTSTGNLPTDNPGFNGTQTFVTPLSFANVTTPEPASLGLLGVVGAALLRRRK